jgi:cell division septation protein DedD
LTPRNLDTGPAPASTPATFRVAPRSAPPPAAAPAPAPIPASLPKAQPLPKAAPEAAAAPLGGKIVQLGAFRSRAEAEKALGNWRRDVASLFQRVAEPAIVTGDLGEKGVFYRVRVPGFADSRKASEFCGEYKGPGRDCYVVP